MLHDLVNAPSPAWMNDGFDIWDKLCGSGDLALLSNLLIRDSIVINFTIGSTKRLWKTLIDHAIKRGFIDELAKLFIENIEGLQLHAANDFYEVYDVTFITKYVFPNTENDNVIIRMLMQLLGKGKFDQLENAEGVELIIALVDNKPIRLEPVFAIISAIIQKNILDPILTSKLGEIPNQIKERAYSFKEHYDAINDNGRIYGLDGWID